MKIWVLDRGVYGCIVIVAESEEEARSFLVGSYHYNEKDEIQSYPIEIGFIHENMGDA